MRVESVVWITERKDVMSGCFFLLTLWAHAAYVRRKDAAAPAPTAWRFYALTLALFVGGLMCKPMLVSLPAVLLIVDFWPLRRAELEWSAACGRRWRTLLMEKLPFFALSLITSVVTVLMQQDKGAFVLDHPLDARLGNAVVSIARYLGKFFWPVDLTVCYPHPGYWPVAAVLEATALVLAVTAFALWQRRRQPWLLAGWLGFLTMLLPTIGVVQVGFQAMADRYTYVPIFGLQAALLWTLTTCTWTPVRRSLATALAVCALVGLSVRTWDQQATWRDPITLFEHALAVTERNEIAHSFLGYTYGSVQRHDEAVAHSRRALEINPQNETARFTLALVHEEKGEIDAAIATYRELLQLGSTSPDTHYRLALLLLMKARPNEALPHLQTAAQAEPGLSERHVDQGMREVLAGRFAPGLAALQVALVLRPEDANAHFGAGLALAQLGRLDDAIAHHEAALKARPDFPEAHAELGLLLLSRGDVPRAETHFRATLDRQPDLAIAHFGLARVAEAQGRLDEATTRYERAAHLGADNSMIQHAAAQWFARQRQFERAVACYERAVALQPQRADLQAELGYALLLTGRRDDAIRAWKAALALDSNLPGLRERLERLDSH
jgi:tetratricopeptide (TPR) repeat protein